MCVCVCVYSIPARHDDRQGLSLDRQGVDAASFPQHINDLHG